MPPKKDEVTPEHLFLNRRRFLRTSIYGASALATAATYRWFRKSTPKKTDVTPVFTSQHQNYTSQKITDSLTSYEYITGYNNYYEFSTDKEAVAQASANWKIVDWSLSVEGLVENPINLSLKDIQNLATEERVYRFRCVEGWSMVIPWLGFPLTQILEKVKPQSEAKYVAFETYYNKTDMPKAIYSGIPLPYTEGLRIDEASHPLTFLATGLYKKNLLNQNGAPIRLIVPWKYGFKSIKSIKKIILTDKEPPTTWNILNSEEYGFYSNVNPEVDHPRWSQKNERRIGEFGLRETLMFNGYEKEVQHLYAGMDLRKYY